jgi:hypothetical protein
MFLFPTLFANYFAIGTTLFRFPPPSQLLIRNSRKAEVISKAVAVGLSAGSPPTKGAVVGRSAAWHDSTPTSRKF